MQIIREEMDAIGGQEFHLPSLNPIEIWEETGRVEAFGDILFQIKNRPYVLAPTHEEVITNIAKIIFSLTKIYRKFGIRFKLNLEMSRVQNLA